MVTKWWWRFHKEPSSLWRQIIVSIHGDQGGIGNELNNNRGLPSSTWKSIGDLNNLLASVNINLHSNFVRKVGDGYYFDFWNEHWIGDCNLQTTYPRLYMLDNDKHCKIYERVTFVDGVQTLNWNW